MSSSLTLKYIIPKSLEDVYPLILDLKKFAQLHPYMTSVELLQPNDLGTNYQVHEKLKLWGFIPMKPSYKVSVVEVAQDKHIRYFSEIKKGLQLTVDFYFTCKDNTITISEHLTLQGMPWIHAVFISLLTKAHQQTFQYIQTKKG